MRRLLYASILCAETLRLLGPNGEDLCSVPIDSLYDLKARAQEEAARQVPYTSCVEIPEQEVIDGVVVARLKPLRIRAVSHEGSTPYARCLMQLSPNGILEERRVMDALTFFNRNPFRKTNLVIAPTDIEDRVDLFFRTDDLYPVQFWVGADNMGANATAHMFGLVRLTAGVLTDLRIPNATDTLLSYTYATQTSPRDFQAHSLQWTLLFPWLQSLDLTAQYAIVHPKQEQFGGVGSQIHLIGAYRVPFSPYYSWPRQEAVFSMVYHISHNATLFAGGSHKILSGNTCAFGLKASYGVQHQFSCQNLSGKIEAVYLPGWPLPSGSHERYHEVRPGAETHALYVRANLEELIHTPRDYEIMLRFQGQFAEDPLLPMEQFVIGGMQTVRGFDETAFLSDAGVIGTIEWRTKPVHFRCDDLFRWLIFTDCGYGHNMGASGEPTKRQATLWSAGLGARYSLRQKLSCAFDWAHPLHHEKNVLSSMSGKFHIALAFNF